MKRIITILTFVATVVTTVFSQNLPPVANNDTIGVEVGFSVTYQILSNDFDQDAILDSNSIQILDVSPNGNFTINNNGTVTYNSIGTFTGTESFRYTICDTGLPVLCDTALIVVNTYSLGYGSSPCTPAYYDFASNNAGFIIDTIPGANAANTFGMNWSPTGNGKDYTSVTSNFNLNSLNMPAVCDTPGATQSSIWISFATTPGVAEWQWQLTPKAGNNDIKYILLVEDPCGSVCSDLIFFKCGNAFNGWDPINLTSLDPSFSYTYHLLLWSENIAEEGDVNLKIRRAAPATCIGSASPSGTPVDFNSECVLPGYCYDLENLFVPSNQNGQVIKKYYMEGIPTGPSDFCPFDTNATVCVDTTSIFTVRIIYESCAEDLQLQVNVYDQANPSCPGEPVVMDVDDDNDGILDVVEICGPNAIDFSCFTACIDCDPMEDDDNDGVKNYMDEDFCTLNAFGVCDLMDADGDGVINSLDKDSDNDGILDSREAQGNTCYTEPSIETDIYGLPINMVTYTNCDDGLSGITYGIIPNDDSDDSDGIADFLDFDSDNDGSPDFVEGFNYITTYSDAIDDYWHFADSFETANTNPGLYLNALDADNDNIPDWLDNEPAAFGWDSTKLPPFQTPGNSNYFDTDNDGVVDLFDGDQGGLPQLYNRPDHDFDGDFDWRSNALTVSLPVALIDFHAQFTGVMSKLSWNSGVEMNFSHYEIERSLDGITWNFIAEVNGKGHNSSYTFNDYDLNGIIGNVYYRLNMIDLDGSHEYSSIVSVLISPIDEIGIFPNPAKDLTYVTGLSQHRKSITIYDMSGSKIKSMNLDEESDQIELEDLLNGHYLLQIEHNGFIITKPLIITK